MFVTIFSLDETDREALRLMKGIRVSFSEREDAYILLAEIVRAMMKLSGKGELFWFWFYLVSYFSDVWQGLLIFTHVWGQALCHRVFWESWTVFWAIFKEGITTGIECVGDYFLGYGVSSGFIWIRCDRCME